MNRVLQLSCCSNGDVLIVLTGLSTTLVSLKKVSILIDIIGTRTDDNYCNESTVFSVDRQNFGKNIITLENIFEYVCVGVCVWVCLKLHDE